MERVDVFGRHIKAKRVDGGSYRAIESEDSVSNSVSPVHFQSADLVPSVRLIFKNSCFMQLVCERVHVESTMCKGHSRFLLSVACRRWNLRKCKHI